MSTFKNNRQWERYAVVAGLALVLNLLIAVVGTTFVPQTITPAHAGGGCPTSGCPTPEPTPPTTATPTPSGHGGGCEPGSTGAACQPVGQPQKIICPVFHTITGPDGSYTLETISGEYVDTVECAGHHTTVPVGKSSGYLNDPVTGVGS